MSFLESVFSLGAIVGVVFLLHVAVLVCAVAWFIWDLIHVIWFRVICRHFDINHGGWVYRTINAIDDQSEWLIRPIELYIDLAEWSWDRLTGKSRRELVKRVAHLAAQLDPVSEHRAFDRGVFLKREAALICRAEKAERLLAETEQLLDGAPEVRCNDLVSES